MSKPTGLLLKGLREENERLKEINTDLLEALQDAVKLIRGTYPMVNSKTLLHRYEGLIKKATS